MFAFVKAYEHKLWESYGLKDYGDFAEKVTEKDQRDCGDCTSGLWFYVLDEPLQHPTEDFLKYRVVYWGTWGNYHAPGADTYTQAELYDCDDEEEMHEFAERVRKLEAKPEWI